jgi:amidase
MGRGEQVTSNGGLVGLTARRLADMVRSGSVSPEAVVHAHLACIADSDPRIGAFQLVRTARALDEARALGARGDLDTLPLAGVPVGIKDNVQVAGEPMRIGSHATPDAPSETDHPTVRRLREAGAIVVGITRVPELCLWGSTDNAFGVTRNPWNISKVAGGSSGGSAAAVAAGMVSMALGADGMGSIRIPAAACGVVGLKPGPGIVPSELGVSSWFGMAENGPLATTVEDAALMLSVLAARDDFRDPPPPSRPLRIAISTSSALPGLQLDPAFAAAVHETGRLLADVGHEVEFADPPAVPLRCVAGAFAHWFGGAAEDAAALDARRLEPRTRAAVRIGRIALRLRLVRARDRERLRRLHEPFFRRCDVLVTPSLATIPRDAGSWRDRSWFANVRADAYFAPFAATWNLTGYPAAAIPAGRHPNGMPLSIQLVAPPGREALILSLARQLETLRPWPRHAPALQ